MLSEADYHTVARINTGFIWSHVNSQIYSKPAWTAAMAVALQLTLTFARRWEGECSRGSKVRGGREMQPWQRGEEDLFL